MSPYEIQQRFAEDGIEISIEQIEKELEDMAKEGLVKLTYEE